MLPGRQSFSLPAFASADRPWHSKQAIKEQLQPASKHTLIHHSEAGRGVCQLLSARTLHKAYAQQLSSLEGSWDQTMVPRTLQTAFSCLGGAGRAALPQAGSLCSSEVQP